MAIAAPMPQRTGGDAFAGDRSGVVYRMLERREASSAARFAADARRKTRASPPASARPASDSALPHLTASKPAAAGGRFNVTLAQKYLKKVPQYTRAARGQWRARHARKL